VARVLSLPPGPPVLAHLRLAARSARLRCRGRPGPPLRRLPSFVVSTAESSLPLSQGASAPEDLNLPKGDAPRSRCACSERAFTLACGDLTRSLHAITTPEYAGLVAGPRGPVLSSHGLTVATQPSILWSFSPT